IEIQAQVQGSDTVYVAHSGSDLRIEEFNNVPSLSSGDIGRTVISPAQVIAGLGISREVTVPPDGNESFARTIDLFYNPTTEAITVPVQIVGNLGSDAGTSVFATSSGNSLVAATD